VEIFKRAEKYVKVRMTAAILLRGLPEGPARVARERVGGGHAPPVLLDNDVVWMYLTLEREVALLHRARAPRCAGLRGGCCGFVWAPTAPPSCAPVRTTALAPGPPGGFSQKRALPLRMLPAKGPVAGGGGRAGAGPRGCQLPP